VWLVVLVLLMDGWVGGWVLEAMRSCSLGTVGVDGWVGVCLRWVSGCARMSESDPQPPSHLFLSLSLTHTHASKTNQQTHTRTSP
jgi:hypothetical protein